MRGVTKLAEAMVVIPLVKRALPAARLPMQDVKTLGAMGAAALGGQLLRKHSTSVVVREAGSAVLSMAPAVLALRGGDLASYHGVEHKSIAAYEQGGEAAEADEGARPLRLAPGRADDGRGRRRQRRRAPAPGSRARPRRPPSGSAAPPSPSRSSPGRSAIPTAG